MSDPKKVHRGDWVKVEGFERIGFVMRLAKDGSFADVRWGDDKHGKRMKVDVLIPQHTISLGDGWTVTNMTRERELKGGQG